MLSVGEILAESVLGSPARHTLRPRSGNRSPIFPVETTVKRGLVGFKSAHEVQLLQLAIADRRRTGQGPDKQADHSERC